MTKGRKVYVEGRLQTRRWTGQDGQERITTEIVINDMIILDSRYAGGKSEEGFDVPDEIDEGATAKPTTAATPSDTKKKKTKKKEDTQDQTSPSDTPDEEDIPF